MTQRWSDVHLIHNDHNRHSYSPCPENENVGLGSPGYIVSFAYA